MIDKRPTRVAGMFDSIAARYDLLNHLLSVGLDRGWRRGAIRAMRPTGGDTLLDVCTGTADLAIEAARHGAGRVVGVDFAAEMLRRGAPKVEGWDRIHLVRGDASRLPVRSASIDVVTAAFGIRNVEHPDRALAEMFRALRPGGRLAILEFSIPASPLVRRIYLPYFRHLLPRVGRLVSGHGTAYTYLPASVGSFIAPAEMTASLRDCGFEQVGAKGLTFGIVTLYTAFKPAAR